MLWRVQQFAGLQDEEIIPGQESFPCERTARVAARIGELLRLLQTQMDLARVNHRSRCLLDPWLVPGRFPDQF